MKNLLIILTIIFLTSCGMSQEERKIWEEKRKEIQKGYIEIIDLRYYDIDSCQYFGKLRNTSSDFITHSGKCPRCEKRQIKIIDSLIKVNLENFIKKKK